MSRFRIALFALLSALLPLAAPAVAEAADVAPLVDDDLDDDHHGHHASQDVVRGQLAAARLRVEAHIASRGLSPERAAAARDEFAVRLLSNLATLRERRGISDEQARVVTAFARAILLGGSVP